MIVDIPVVDVVHQQYHNKSSFTHDYHCLTKSMHWILKTAGWLQLTGPFCGIAERRNFTETNGQCPVSGLDI